VAQLGVYTVACAPSAISEEAHYCIAIAGNPASYTLTATPRGGQATADSGKCSTIVLALDGSQTSSGTESASACWGKGR